MAGDTQTLQALNTYIDGKIKRYNLMFAVNGGIFALAKLISVPAESNPLGRLKLIHLSIGAITKNSWKRKTCFPGGARLFFHRSPPC